MGVSVCVACSLSVHDLPSIPRNFIVSAPTSPAAPAAPAKSKKTMIIIVVVVAVLAMGGAAAAWFIKSRAHAEDGDGEVSTSKKETPKVAPTFLPLENMVVNLSDPGGDRFAQIGITLELTDAKVADQVKVHLPTIRSGILLLVSQRTSEELLQIEGKEKLASDILREVSRPLGYNAPSKKKREPVAESGDDEAERPQPRRAEPNPVQRVLFSSFIIQ